MTEHSVTNEKIIGAKLVNFAGYKIIPSLAVLPDINTRCNMYTHLSFKKMISYIYIYTVKFQYPYAYHANVGALHNPQMKRKYNLQNTFSQNILYKKWCYCVPVKIISMFNFDSIANHSSNKSMHDHYLKQNHSLWKIHFFNFVCPKM